MTDNPEPQATTEQANDLVNAVDRTLACATYVDAGLRQDVARAIREELQSAAPRPEVGDEMVERVARAIHSFTAEPERGDTWGALSGAWRENYRTHARAALNPVSSEGTGVVGGDDD